MAARRKRDVVGIIASACEAVIRDSERNQETVMDIIGIVGSVLSHTQGRYPVRVWIG